jgi:hypothetical protein
MQAGPHSLLDRKVGSGFGSGPDLAGKVIS